ncbi:hypothetical protein ABBQ32_013417 [Trebouxia sp. C0010 RCD-2024]
MVDGHLEAITRVVGFAVSSDKAKKHLRAELLRRAEAVHIKIIAIDPLKPVAEQGPFDLILQKCRDEGWRQRLVEYAAQHPQTKLIDSFDSVQSLMTRETMLQHLTEPLSLHPPEDSRHSNTAELDTMSCAAPVQKALLAGCTEEEASQIIDDADIRFPLLAKPYYTDGRQGSHGLALIEDIDGLRRLVRGTGPPGIALPVMLQPFIEHGGCLFKVYVMGTSIALVHRPSLQLPPEDADVTAQRKGIQTMTRVSAFHSTSPMGCELVEGPPDWLLHKLAAALRTALNLQLFNFDLMRPTERDAPGSKGADFLVNINYFPGYEKLPNHAALMVDFLQSLLSPAKEQVSAKERGTQVQRHLSSCLDDAGSDSE